MITNNDFKVMLFQCEKIAKKLAKAEIDDNFFTLLDTFDASFEQLRQVIENNGGKTSEEDIKNLRDYILAFTQKLEQHKQNISENIKNAKNFDKINSYKSSTAHGGALKFDIRS